MKLSILSFSSIFEGLKRVMVRFPFTLALCGIGTAIGVRLVHMDDDPVYIRLLFTLALTVPVSVIVTLFVEAMGWRKEWSWFGSIALIALMSGYYTFLPEIDAPDAMIFYIRHGMWVVASVLTVTFMLFIRESGAQAVLRFWEFCRRLLFSTFLTWVWALAIQFGIFAALFATDTLFDLEIPSERYSEIWVVIVGLFCTTFFLSRLPKGTDALEKASYPKEVRLFSQFVLVPLVLVYFVILYVYTAKILLTGEWPQGQLAYIILGFSAVGLLTYIALFPLREQMRWIRYAGIALCVAMIPQAFMLFWSLWFRVSEYGVTENRYFVFIFGAWLIGVSLYLLIRNVKDLRVIPVSLVVMIFVTSVGPWGAFSTAIRSQVDRLESILEQNGRFQEGRYVVSEVELSEEDFAQVRAVMNFLEDRNAIASVQGWLDEEVDLSGVEIWEQGEYFLEHGLELTSSTYPVRPSASTRIDYGHTNDSLAGKTSGYEYFFEIGRSGNETYQIDDKIFTFDLNAEQQEIEMYLDEIWVGSISLKEILQDEADKGLDDEVVLYLETEQVKVMYMVKSFYAREQNDSINLNTTTGIVFLTIK